jgi:dTDP-4-amino-4,6-dideoxygalactose transaminase
VERIYLSPPDVGEEERKLLLDAFDSNWIAPLGPHVDAFEAEIAERTGVPYALALSSGTAALHLALLLVGVGRGDEVLVPTLTFVSSANAALYLGAQPVLVDCDAPTWQVDPELVADELRSSAQGGRLPAAVVVVDLYGQAADYGRLVPLCEEYGVPLVEDAAEALGATYRGSPAGSFGAAGTLSFNGNKIITTSGGGMLVSRSEELVGHARHLATQARAPVPWYEHSETGYNYRLSNLLAAIGRAQLQSLDDRIARRLHVSERYRAALSSLPGITFMPRAPYGEPNNWLTCVVIDPGECGADREAVRLALEAENIEARPTWKPLHLQPLFSGARVVGGSVAAAIFERGLCLPSGSSLTEGDLDRVIDVLTGSVTR